ncbi:MAG: hypothetical protein V2J55_03450 [Candidatus Competibacteraceae bacterium]|jgi:hypothetical protein|nr:hypothetical protein [Candidatus Competibacteraceae bacterium]
MNERNDHSDWDDEISALYRKIPQPVPSTDLDNRLLQAARQPVQPSATKTRRWPVPVAMAAVLVLGIGLVRTMDREMPHSPEPSALQTPQFEAQSGLGSRTMASEKKADIATPAPRPDAESQLQRLGDRENSSDQLEQHRVIPESIPAPAPLREQEEIRGRAEAEKRSDRQGQPKFSRAPLVWLQEIAALRRKGRDAEAKAGLEEFKRHYPDYPLPAHFDLPEQLSDDL